MGPHLGEEVVLRTAHAYEQATTWHNAVGAAPHGGGDRMEFRAKRNQPCAAHSRARSLRQGDHLRHRRRSARSVMWPLPWTGQPFVIPTIHARMGDEVILHGAKASRLLKHIEAGNPVSVAMTLLDGLVMARSVFHSSMNYRSAVIFGAGRVLAQRRRKAGRAGSIDRAPGTRALAGCAPADRAGTQRDDGGSARHRQRVRQGAHGAAQ